MLTLGFFLGPWSGRCVALGTGFPSGAQTVPSKNVLSFSVTRRSATPVSCATLYQGDRPGLLMRSSMARSSRRPLRWNRALVSVLVSLLVYHVQASTVAPSMG